MLSVNFWSSTGFGKAFVNAGDREWGRRMDDDPLDAAAWAGDQKIADPRMIAIMGGSYGGYATLVGLTRNPEIYACGIDIVGPSNLETLIQAIPPYWEAFRSRILKAIGDPDTEEGLRLLRERSPCFKPVGSPSLCSSRKGRMIRGSNSRGGPDVQNPQGEGHPRRVFTMSR